MLNAATPAPYPRVGPSPAELLPRLMAWRACMGITRIADITGLDRIGFPVMQAVRPFSLSNAVSQGKGADQTAAAISALLECAESFCAERVERFETEIASADALNVPAGRFEKHLLEPAPRDWPSREIAWVRARDLLSGRSEPVPFELVHTAYVASPPRHEGLFAGTTTGLAAALAEEDAIVHAILECVERDAIARANRVHGFLHRFRIDPATIRDAALCALLETLAAKGMLVGLWHAPSPVGLPVVWCHLMEAGEEGALLPSAADGSAAAFEPSAAVAHAVCEAAQARLAAISGSRDDLTRRHFRRYPDRARIAAHRRLLAEGPCPIDFDSIVDGPLDGVALEPLLSRLDEHGIGSVLLVRIDTAPLIGLSVVRAVIPELEPLLS